MRNAAAVKTANGNPATAETPKPETPAPPRVIPKLAKLHPGDAAAVLLSLREDGVERVAELAKLTDISVKQAETLLCLGLAVLTAWGWGEKDLCKRYRLTPQQVQQALRACPTELLAQSV